ncbi:MAG: tetratricopeptide repeat protein [Candidatus Gastranaerophilales bacterium]|nr:tetratricopeptide repeat protein [Candidatus Gastranaerophilales bacterium]
MKRFWNFILGKIRNLDKQVKSYDKNSMHVLMPSKAFLNWGINLAVEGKIDAAIEKFEMSSKMFQKNPEIFTNWGIALAKLHRFDEAVDKFDEALRIDRTYSSAYSLKGAALVELNRVDEAIECYHIAVEYAPNDPEIYINWGIAYARLNDKPKAEAKFQKALSLSLGNVHAAFLLAVVLYEQNKLKEAQEAFIYVTALDKYHSMAYYYLSLCYTKLEDFESALRNAKIATQIVPFKVDFMVNLAECYLDVKDIKSTIKTYRAIALIEPESFAFNLSAGIFWQKVKKYQKSLKYLNKAMQSPQADTLTRYYYAVSLAGSGNYEEAKGLFHKIIEDVPHFYDSAVKLAIIYKMEENYQKAIELLTNVFANSKQFEQFHKLLGDCYRLSDNLEKAVEQYKIMLEYCPEDYESYLQLAQIYLHCYKDTKNALRNIRAGYKINKNLVSINTVYALVLEQDKDFNGALEKIEEAIKVDENNIESYLKKIRFLKEAGQNDKYNEVVEFVKNKFPEKIEYIDNKIANFHV